MIKYSELIDESLKWTASVLLKPLSLKKWVFLTFSMTMAGAYISGCTSSVNLPDIGRGKSAEVQSAEQGQQKKESPKKEMTLAAMKQKAAEKWRDPFIRAVMLLGVFLLSCLMALFTWLYSRFVFVFIDNIAANDASIRRPFRESARMGNSYFIFLLVVTFIGLILIAFVGWSAFSTLKAHGVFVPGQKHGGFQILSYLVPYIMLFLAFLPISAIASFLVRDIAVVIMYKEKAGIMRGISALWELVCRFTPKIFLYMLVRLGLAISAVFIAGAVSLAAIIGLIIPVGMSCVAAAGLYFIMPKVLVMAYTVLMVIAAVAAGFILSYAMMLLELPFAVFLRTLGMKFLAAMEPSYNVFSRPGESAGAQPVGHAPGLALLLSLFIPGLGQVYNGEYAKGVAVFSGSGLIAPWLMGIVDAYQAAGRIKRGERAHTAHTGVVIGFACGMLSLLVVGGLIFIIAVVAWSHSS